MFHPKTRPNWCKEVKCLTGSLKFRVGWGAFFSHELWNAFFLHWTLTRKVDLQSFIHLWKEWKRGKSILPLSARIILEKKKKKFKSTFFYIVYPNYYCSKFLKCFHEQKASFIAIFLFSCLQYMYYLFVQYYFQTINCIKAFCRKEKLIQLSFMLGSCQTVFFNIKSNGLWLIFQFLADCSNIRWFSGWKKNVLRFNYM